ncbi:MAG: cellulose synthase catalytic subunit [Pseudomonadota bacterium]
MTWRLTVRIAPPAPRGLSVDVFIPTFNEPVQLVRRTLLATIHMDYPHETWLLDDGNRPEMASLAEDLGVRYLARERNTDAKAGNLNNALANSSAEFVAVFDADHAPQQNFLTHTLGYFNDPAVAFVQTPQDFFNLDSYQHRQQTRKHTVWTEQSLFFRVIQRGKDYWNAAFFCGSCATLRRSALEKIGGFATGTVTEDLHTSIRLHKQGFKSVYHAEPLAFGIAPSSVVPFLQQRIRWGQGACRSGAKNGF